MAVGPREGRAACVCRIGEGFAAGGSGGHCPTPDRGRGSSMLSRAEWPRKEQLSQGARGVPPMEGKGGAKDRSNAAWEGGQGPGQERPYVLG